MVKKIIVYAFIILGEIFAIYFSFSFFWNITFKTCNSCKFIDNAGVAGSFAPTLYFTIFYSFASFYLNIKTTRHIRTNFYNSLLGLTVTDILIIPLSMILMVFYYRYKGVLNIEKTNLLNFYVIALIVFIKHIIIIGAYDFFIKRSKPQ